MFPSVRFGSGQLGRVRFGEINPSQYSLAKSAAPNNSRQPSTKSGSGAKAAVYAYKAEAAAKPRRF